MGGKATTPAQSRPAGRAEAGVVCKPLHWDEDVAFCKLTLHKTRQFFGSGGAHAGVNELLKACCSACRMQRSVWLRSLTDTVPLFKDWRRLRPRANEIAAEASSSGL